MKDTRAIGKMAIAAIIIVIIIIAAAAGYYLTMPTGPKLKETLIMGTTDSVESCLDPARAYDFFGWQIIQSLSSGLVEYKAGATGAPDDIVPSLATDWTVSTNGMEYTFNLKQNVKYDDGTEFNATHVKYTFDRGIAIADEDGPFLNIGYGDIIENVTAVSKYVVKFYLKIPFAAFLSLLACQASYIVDPTYAPMTVVEYNASTTSRNNHPMGLGPYKLTNWTRIAGRDYEIRLEANSNYWNASGGYPKTKNIIIRMYSDATSLATAITSGDIDIAFRQLTTSDINTMKTNANLHVWEGTGAFIQYLCFQQNGSQASSPFNNTKIRQAVAAAINRTALVQTVFLGDAEKLYSMIPIGMFGHSDSFLTFGDPNYTRTQQLLSEVGYSTTNKLTFELWYETSGHYPQSPQQAAVLKSSLEASGVISVTLVSRDWASYRDARRNEIMQAYILGWYPDYIDPDDYIFPFVHSVGGSWIHHNYANPEMDQLIEWARGNTTSTARNTLYQQIQDLMVTDAAIVPLYQGTANAVTKTNVKGIYLDITQSWRHWLVYAEQ